MILQIVPALMQHPAALIAARAMGRLAGSEPRVNGERLTPRTKPRNGPLAETLVRCAALGLAHPRPSARVGPAPGPGWVACGDASLAAELDALLTLAERSAGTHDRRVSATFALEAYAWALVMPALVAYLAERRIPDVAADNVALRFDADGEGAEVSYVTARFAALRGDGGAGVPEAIIVRDETALLAWFRRRLTHGHLDAVIEHLAPRSGRTTRALWASVEDVCSGVFGMYGDELGCGDWARGQADVLLGVEAPLSGRARYRELRWSGGTDVIRERNGCCQSLRRGSDARSCLTCTRTSQAERVRRREERGPA